MIDQLVVEYVDYATKIKNDTLLGDNIKPQMLLQMAQALSYLVPLSNTAADQQTNLIQQQQQHDQQMQIAQQKHALDMQMTQEKHQMGLQQQQDKHALTLQIAKQKPNNPTQTK